MNAERLHSYFSIIATLLVTAAVALACRTIQPEPALASAETSIHGRYVILE